MTTPDPKTHVLVWRSEIAEELEGAENEIPALMEAHVAATAAASDAADFHDALQRLLGVEITRPEPAINLRWEDYRREVKEAKSRKAMAAAALEAARTRVVSLQKALAQIDRVVPVED